MVIILEVDGNQGPWREQDGENCIKGHLCGLHPCNWAGWALCSELPWVYLNALLLPSWKS